jgi:hypothetical protein
MAPFGSGLARGGSGSAAGEGIHLGKDAGSFDLQELLGFLVIFFREFSCAKFKAEVAQIVVDGLAAIDKLVELGATRREIGRFRANSKDEEDDGGGKEDAGNDNIEIAHRRRAPSERDSGEKSVERYSSAIEFFVHIASRARKKLGRNRQSIAAQPGDGPSAPTSDQLPEDKKGDERCDDGHDPSDPIEATRRRLGENRGTVFLNERLKDERVGFVLSDAVVELLQHFVRVSAPDVVTGGEDLIATANAKELVTELLGVVGLLRQNRRRKKEQKGKEASKQREKTTDMP